MPVACDSNVGARGKYVDLSDSRGWNPRVAGQRTQQIAGAQLLLAARVDRTADTLVPATVTSLAIPRLVSVTLGGRVIATITASPTSVTRFSFRVPPGQGIAKLVFRASPPAASASQVTPGDDRMLAVQVGDFSVR